MILCVREVVREYLWRNGCSFAGRSFEIKRQHAEVVWTGLKVKGVKGRMYEGIVFKNTLVPAGKT